MLWLTCPPCKGLQNGLCCLEQHMLVQVQVHQVLKLTRKGIFTAEIQWAMVNPYNDTDITQRPSLWHLLHPLGPWERPLFPQMIFLPLPKCVHTKKPAVSKQINKYYQDRKPREVELEFCDLKEPPLCLVAWSVPCFFQVICLVIMVVWGEWGGGDKSAKQLSLWTPASQPVSPQYPGLRTRSCAGISVLCKVT